MEENCNSNKILVPHKQDILMQKLSSFYNDLSNLNKILPIISGRSCISLRIIDWFVTNYAKKNNTRIISCDPESQKVKQFIVYINYKSQLKAYTKKQFDPFCRRERIRFFYTDENQEEPQYIVTTVGQLNFFRWAIQHNIIEYISDNLKEIELDMNTCVKKIKNINEKSNRKKRQELSISATKSINKHNIEIIVNFD